MVLKTWETLWSILCQSKKDLKNKGIVNDSIATILSQ